MATTFPTAIANAALSAACDSILDAIDAGTTDANGDIVLQTAADVIGATLELQNPAAGAAANGVGTFNTVSNDSAAAGDGGNPITKGRVRDRDNGEVIGFAVAESGAEINFTDAAVDGSVRIPTNAIVSLNPPTLTLTFV